MKRSKIKHSRSNQVFYIFNTIFWIIFMFLIIYPLYLVCIASVSDPDAIVAGNPARVVGSFTELGKKRRALEEGTSGWDPDLRAKELWEQFYAGRKTKKE